MKARKPPALVLAFANARQTTTGGAVQDQPRSLGDKMQLLAWTSPELLDIVEGIVDDFLAGVSDEVLETNQRPRAHGPRNDGGAAC